MDIIDSKIIVCLQKDGRMSYRDIASNVSISEATARSRVKKLIDNEVLQIVAVCEPKKIGFAFEGIVRIRVQPNKKKYVIEELKKIKEIWYISQGTGNVDVSIEFCTNSIDHLDHLLNDQINFIDGIINTESTIIFKHEKRNYNWGTGFDYE